MRATILILIVCLMPTLIFADVPINVKSEIESRALLFFIENAQPDTGQVRDSAENFIANSSENRVASIAATGFGLAVIANGSTRGLVTAGFAHDYVLKTLKFVTANVPRRKGWFLHFYDWETGARMFESEYSTIDTALFLTGALYASAILHDAEISKLTYDIYNATDFWDALTDGGAQPQKKTLSMAYFEESGYTPAQWNMYAEEMSLLILGLGHPTHPLPPEAWLAFDRNLKNIPSTGEAVMGLDQALFVHQYSQLYIDFHQFNDGFKNYFDNSKSVSLYHRALTTLDQKYKTLREGFWGMSAGELPDGYGASSALNYQSTVCIGCAVASAPYFPEEVLSDSAHWINGPYSKMLWGRYGLTDSIDLDQNWFSSVVLGITVGPEYLALANLDEKTSIWHVFMGIPEIKNGLDVAAHANSKQ